MDEEGYLHISDLGIYKPFYELNWAFLGVPDDGKITLREAEEVLAKYCKKLDGTIVAMDREARHGRRVYAAIIFLILMLPPIITLFISP